MQTTTTTRGGLRAVAMGMLVAVLGTVAMAGWAHPAASAPDGGGPGPRGRGMGSMFMGSPERVERAVDRLLKGLDATDAQRQQVKAIAVAATKDLHQQQAAGRELRAQARALFTAPTVDEAAVEALRQKTMAHHDAMSRRVSRAMLDVAQVLDARQREALAARLDQRGARGHRPMRHRDHGGLPSGTPLS